MFAMNGRRQESAWGWTHGKFGNSCKMSTSQCVIISKQLVTIRATATDSLIHASQLTRLLVTLSKGRSFPDPERYFAYHVMSGDKSHAFMVV